MADFGNKFRRARESKKLSLDDISKITKIGTRMLKAIEEENFDQLPGGVFNKGFIRTYAKQVGMDEEQAVTDYLACLQEQLEAQSEAANADRASAHKPHAIDSKKSAANTEEERAEELPHLQLPRFEDVRPARKHVSEPGGFPWALALLAAVVVVLAVFLWIRHSRSRSNSVQAAPPIAASNAVAPAAVPAANPPAITAPKASAKSPVANSSKIVPGTSQTVRAATGNAEPLAGDGAPRSVAPVNQKTTDKPAAPLTLVIRATENSWISVLADGQPLVHETLIAPARTTVRANTEITVRVGNAAGVAFVWNGHEVPAEGVESEVKSFTFDSTGMHALAPTPSAAQNQ